MGEARRPNGRMQRRLFLLGAAGLAAGAVLRFGRNSLGAGAVGGRDVSFVIPYAPGGGFDAYVRAVIPALQEALGVRVLPDNEDGAGGARAANLLHRARADGSTISVVNVPGVLILQRQGTLGFDLLELSWLANMGRDSYGLMVPADSSVRSLDDLRALGRRRPVKFTCIGPAGTGYSATRIGAHLLDIPARVIAGYKGTNDYVVAALRGDGDAAVASLTALNQFQAAGLIRILATFEASGTLPGVPDATALGLPELAQIVQLRPIAAPPGLPAADAATLSDALVRALRDPSVLAWAQRNHANLTPDDAVETRRLLVQQKRFVERWKDFLAAD
ncbi:MAG TPA: tripartite tricarboxylate transporter substrate-binding protein [Aliidongia sp.]|nr:tripartite tricarboxylate transporter substrate-binding protein [Aliidongia sp.]